MMPEDIRKLLGGYATGTLTDEEQQALFAAALEDQELFDALAREQSLRDLLRDPAARGDLLAALDTAAPRPGSFWNWLRRPAIAGLAAAGVVAIAVIAVWQGTHLSGVKPARTLVADLKPQELRPAPPPATPPAEAPAQPPPRPMAASTRTRAFDSAAPLMADKEKDQKAAPPMALPPPPPPPSATFQARRAEAEPSAPAIPPPPPAAQAFQPRADEVDAMSKAIAPAAPAVMARKKEEAADSTALRQAIVSSSGALGALQENVTIDARTLFYEDQPAPPARKGAAAPMTKSVSGFGVAPMPQAAAPRRLGVRVSILRGDREVDLTTVLDPSETVRLKLTPNADGFLYVVEGIRTLASGTAQRLKPFETPELHFEGAGQKHLYIMLSRRPQTVLPLSLDSLARGNLAAPSAEDLATYVVSGTRDPNTQQVVLPVTLTYR